MMEILNEHHMLAVDPGTMGVYVDSDGNTQPYMAEFMANTIQHLQNIRAYLFMVNRGIVNL